MHSSKFRFSAGRLALALVVAMALSFTGGLQAFAFDTGGLPAGSKGSITVHKYKTASPSATPGTGSETDADKLPPDAQVVPGVEFSIYPLDTAKVEGGNGGAPATSAPTQEGVQTFVNDYGKTGVSPTKGTTGSDGKFVFSGLDLGYYLLVETSETPNVDPAVPTIITIPYAQQAVSGSTTYVSDVHVYPKNVSNLAVEKNFQGQTPDHTSPGDTLKYQISATVPNTAAKAQTMTGSIVDNIPKNQAGSDMLTIGSWKAFALGTDGSRTDISSSVQFAAPGTWNINATTGKAIADIDKAMPSGQSVNKIQIQFDAFVTDAAYYAATDTNFETLIANTANINLKSGSETIHDNEEADAPAVPVSGFGFEKVDSNDVAITESFAHFKIASSFDNANAKKFLQFTPDGSTTKTDIEAVTNSSGMAALSGLDSKGIFENGGAVYTGVSQAITNAENSPGSEQKVELWIQETQAPDGYRILQAPQKITLSIIKGADNGPLTFKIVGEPMHIKNYKDGESGGGNFALPNTGGLGGILLIAAGIVVFALGVTAYARNRRRQRLNNSQE